MTFIKFVRTLVKLLPTGWRNLIYSAFVIRTQLRVQDNNCYILDIKQNSSMNIEIIVREKDKSLSH